MTSVDLRLGDNLATLAELKAAGQKFDLVEVDGPYMAGLEDWDSLSEVEYIQHYAERLALVRDVLQPWGVVFVFGYPEGCAEIKSWAHRTGTLYCRRWLTWYNKLSAHEGRKTQTVLVLAAELVRRDILIDFGNMLREKRTTAGMSLHDVGVMCGRDWWHRGGNFYYETGRNVPSRPDYKILKHVFDFGDEWDIVTNSAYVSGNYDGLTNRDFITCNDPENTTHLNDAGLRSKPVQLYLDLFRPTIPPTDTRRALVLYGGSGNAGIAAAALGYDVTICEADPARVALIRDRWAGQVAKWTEKAQAKQAALPIEPAKALPLFSAEAAA